MTGRCLRIFTGVTLAAAAALGAAGLTGPAASQRAEETQLPGQTVVGRMSIEGYGTVDIRGVDLGFLAGTGSPSGGGSTPGTFAPIEVVKDVDGMSPSLMLLVLNATRPKTVTIELLGPDGNTSAVIVLTSPRAAATTIAHEGRVDERLLETLVWDVSSSKLRLTVGATTTCWEPARGRCS